MYWLPLGEGGDIGPTKSMPIWYHGDTTGIGWSSGAAVSIFLPLRWQTSHFFIYINVSDIGQDWFCISIDDI